MVGFASLFDISGCFSKLLQEHCQRCQTVWDPISDRTFSGIGPDLGLNSVNKSANESVCLHILIDAFSVRTCALVTYRTVEQPTLRPAQTQRLCAETRQSIHCSSRSMSVDENSDQSGHLKVAVARLYIQDCYIEELF